MVCCPASCRRVDELGRTLPCSRDLFSSRSRSPPVAALDAFALLSRWLVALLDAALVLPLGVGLALLVPAAPAFELGADVALVPPVL